MGHPLVTRLLAMPWWVKILLIFVASRVITTLIVLVVARHQDAVDMPLSSANPGYFDYAVIWDGAWYKFVAGWGYPAILPVTPDGHVTENAWAFMPAYPSVVAAVMALTGLEWGQAAVFVSGAFGFGTALILYRILVRVTSDSAALFAVVLFCVAPLSPLLQVGYAESMGLFCLALALYLVLDRHYVALYPVIVVLAFTRPLGVAFALFMSLHAVHRWIRRKSERFPLRERVIVGTSVVFSALVGFAWPAIAWIVTGVPSAYTSTELAWREPYIGRNELIPFAAWFQGGLWWLGFPLGIFTVAALVAGFGLFLMTPWARRIGVDLRLWCASYALYLLAVFFPQSSTFRLLMPLFPLLGALAQPRSAWFRTVLVVAGIAGQLGWLVLCWRVVELDWTPP